MERWLEICIYDRWKFASGRKDFSMEDAFSFCFVTFMLGVGNFKEFYKLFGIFTFLLWKFVIEMSYQNSIVRLTILCDNVLLRKS